MKQVINGLIYDTETAELVCHCSSDVPYASDFSYWSADLYKTPRGRFFLCGRGGPMTMFAVTAGNNSWSGGSGIVPLSTEEARSYCERERMDADELSLYFDLDLA